MSQPSDPVVTLLRDLVSIDSVNPGLSPGAPGEAEIARRLAEELRAAGLSVTVTDVAPGRPNVVGVLEGRRPGRSLMLCGHTDTVGVTGMGRPFEPRIHDGRLYGRGSQDMKSGVAAMVDAARRLAEAGGLEAGRLLVAAVVDEEHMSLGADALVQNWRADAAIVTEPTDLDIAVAHKGFQWISVETRGRAAHGSRPREGRDAILRMGRVLSRLEQLDRRLQGQRAHPLLGHPSLHASIIEGGVEASSYPARATLTLERRTLPAEAADVGLAEVEAILRELRHEDAEFDSDASLLFGRGGYEIGVGARLPAMLAEAAASVGRLPALVGMTFWTDAAILGAAGIPTVLFGPGGAGLHGTDEYTRVDEVCRCRDVLVEFARRFCIGE